MHPFRQLTAVALAALVAAGCDGGTGAPDTAPSSSARSLPPPRTVEVPDATSPASPSGRPATPNARATVTPPDGTRVLAGPVDGNGPGLVATARVPARFAVVVGCTGTGRFVIVVEGRRPLTTQCGPRSDEFVYQTVGKPGQVTVRIETATSVQWAVMVTTATR